ncbi:hypothetical protein BA190_09215 [Labrys sp. WJW]|uniref:hypothetical protein n=1 Tax=Labrys sp. WJW TaxID=1737983 RepID=UPI00082C8C86|nr:hypothetical protein [Labrys sp. WJW]OCC05084.1 hypothetical protein BA190_09215 [Labrys sp. WJW]
MQIDREAAKKAAYAFATANNMGAPGSAEDEAEAIQMVCDLVGHYFAAAPAGKPVAWTPESLREHARDQGWYIRESASVPDLLTGGWKHPYSVTVSDRELLTILNAAKPAPAQLGGDGDPLRTAVGTLLDYIGCYVPEHREAATVEAVRLVMGLTRFRYAEVQKHLDQVADIAAQLEKEKRDPARAITFTYMNWRGEVGERNAVPISIHYGATEWHPEPQWLMRAFDLDKQAERDFALKDTSMAV